MSITAILGDKDVKSAEKLELVGAIVTKAREAYGNAEVEIEDLRVNTTHGLLPFSSLEADSKVEILKNESTAIKAAAITFVEDNPGALLNKKVQELLSTNAYFANMNKGADYDYL